MQSGVARRENARNHKQNIPYGLPGMAAIRHACLTATTALHT
jgi:hypothetical protein